MSKLFFHIRNAIYGLKSNKILNMIVLISISIGMMYPIIAGTIIEGILKDVQLSEYQDAKHISILEYFAPYTKQSEMDTKIKGLADGINNFGYLSLYFTDVNLNGKKVLCALGGISNNYLSLEGYELRKGRLITEEEQIGNKHVCLFESKGDSDIKVGDSLSIMGDSYEVVGIISSPKCYGGILIPYKAFEASIGSNSIQYKLIIHTKQIPVINEMSKKLNFADRVISVANAADNSKPYYASVWALVLDRIGIGLIILLFAVINIIMIIVGKTIDELYVLGVKTAVGASYGRVFFEYFLQIGILMIIALVLDFLLFPIVKQNYKLIYSYPDIHIFLIMMALGLVIAWFVSLLGISLVLRKKTISDLVKIR